jgi:hypothetical protein
VTYDERCRMGEPSGLRTEGLDQRQGTRMEESVGLSLPNLANVTNHEVMRSLVGGNESHLGRDAHADRQWNVRPSKDIGTGEPQEKMVLR